MMRRALLIVCFFLLICIAALPVFAAVLPAPQVGRVSTVDGGVALRQAAGEWTDSQVNDPVAAGMSVRTAPQGRAVLRVGPDTIALAGGSEADLAKLDSSGTQVTLRQGRIGLRLSALDPAHSIEVDIPKGGVWLLSPGDYEIDAGDQHAPARVAALAGRARFVGKGIDAEIAAGSAAILNGGDPITQQVTAASADGFTTWWQAAGGPADAQALRHVSPEMTGYEALDGNGSWETDPVYGAVWFPKATPAQWAPYRDGHWRWVAPWGWTWIDDMPWAFAPSHYGRWAKIEQTDALDPASQGPMRWGWVPGKPGAAPAYAPALVAFLGTAGIGLSYPGAVGPAIGWFPLAPGEPYWPGYTVDLETIRHINQPSVADVDAIGPAVDGLPPAAIVNGSYRNREEARVVPRSVFVGGRPVRPALLTLPDRRLENAPLLAGSPQIGPPAPHPVQAAQAAETHRAAPAAVTAARTSPPAVAREVGRQNRPVVRAAVLVRRRFVRGSIRLRERPHWAGLHQRRRLIAVASHGRPRLRLATAHRAAIR